ncbi:hypothetical protein O3M35_007294 [Rhynocoris fuscipes]|uniref:Cytochrome P450 n=1 Tax=Rhynocoris fuscipes TaxID=488301 RepID=A0AAW1D8X8_9HEMI
MLTATLFFIIFLYVLFYIIRKTLWAIRAAKMTANLPGLKAWPIIGSALYFINMKTTEDMFKIQQILTKSYSKSKRRIAKFWLGPKLIIVLANPKYVEIVLSSKDALEKDPLYDYIGLVATGMLIKNGTKWHELRKPFNKILNKNKLESSITKISERAQNLCKLWRSKAENEEMFDLRPDIGNYFADNVCDTVFGYNLNELENNKLNLVECMESTLNIVFKMMVQVPYNLNYTYAKFSSAGRKLQKHSRVLVDQCLQILKEYREKKKNPEDQDKELSKSYAETVLEVGKRYNLNEENTARLAIDVFVAGFDTSSVTAACVLLMLAMFPEHQEEVYQEQVKIVGEDPDIIPTMDQLNSMVYLNRIIKEVLRLYCPIGILRRLTEDIDLGEYKLPKGCTLYIMLYYLHRDRQYWSHPDQFYPDHFLDEAVANRPKGAYLPFSWGPRACPGKAYGLMTNKILISTIIRNFKFETDLKFNELSYKYALQTEVSQGYHCRIKRRNKLTQNAL